MLPLKYSLKARRTGVTLVSLLLILTSMEEALLFLVFCFGEEHSTHKSGRVTASCKSDFTYEVLVFLIILLQYYIINCRAFQSFQIMSYDV